MAPALDQDWVIKAVENKAAALIQRKYRNYIRDKRLKQVQAEYSDSPEKESRPLMVKKAPKHTFSFGNIEGEVAAAQESIFREEATPGRVATLEDRQGVETEEVEGTKPDFQEGGTVEERGFRIDPKFRQSLAELAAKQKHESVISKFIHKRSSARKQEGGSTIEDSGKKETRIR